MAVIAMLYQCNILTILDTKFLISMLIIKNKKLSFPYLTEMFLKAI